MSHKTIPHLSDSLKNRKLFGQHPGDYFFYIAYRKNLSWAPTIHDNLLVFYGNEQEKNHIVETFLKQRPKDTKPRYYWFLKDNPDERTLSPMDVTLADSEWRLAQLIEEFYKVAKSVEKQCNDSGNLSPNKRYDYLFLEINQQDLKTLQWNDVVWEKLEWLIRNGAQYRFPVVVFAEESDNTYNELASFFRYIMYLGNINSEYAFSKYSDMRKGYYHVGRKIHGTAWSDLKASLPILQLNKMGEKNTWSLEMNHVKETKKKIYNNFLEGLD